MASLVLKLKMLIKFNQLLMKKYQLYINGNQVSTEQHFEIKNPATDETIGFAPIASPEQIQLAINAAKESYYSWAAKSNEERKIILLRVADVLSENAEYLATWITKEQGKPLDGPGSRFEIGACVAWTKVNASIDLPVEVVFQDEKRRDELHRNPIGVVGAIAPWNWPLMIAIWQIIPSLRAGNTVVIKPSEYTPIGTLEMVRLINTVLPAGVLNIIAGDGKVGQALVESKDVQKIMFTGSVSTGQKIIAASAANMARLTLELGGNDAAIVLPDANIEDSAVDLFWGAFINMGQTCACIKRLYVHEDKYEAIIDALHELAKKTAMGNGLHDGVILGPVQNRMQYKKVVELVEDAKVNGARIVCGGKPVNGAGNFYPVTIVADIKDGTRLVDEEQFGPVLPVIKYSTIDEAIQLANNSKVGLGASVWSSNNDFALEVAKKMEAGTVWLNQHGAIHPLVPFGGIKGSGYGLEFGIEGLKAVTVPKVISIKL
jgi:acyl-CoA reductase-like NAD-dependent aldehyde dehydrogenase